MKQMESVSESEAAYIEVERLVEKFKSLSTTKRRKYNEAATRQAFILPLFSALGWDTADASEVSPEEKVSRGWVDFAFRLSGIPRFFLETKKIAEDLTDPRWVKQAIDYAWTKSVTWALLSDFEGLRVFNAEWKEHNPLRAQFIEFSVDTYLSDFERLWWLSRSQVAVGTLDREAEKVGKKVRKEPVNKHLFDDLRQWRHELFRHLRAYNEDYSLAQIDEAVLRILNRLIFVRTAEDREVEPPRLLPLLRELEDRDLIARVPSELSKLFREFDSTYDSDLFAEHFSEKLECEPTPFQILIEGLHEKRGGYMQYNFNAIDADVLGTVYEQYLGHVIADPQAVEVVERKIKRKAQGIYYTPTFVVKYIVQQTLGRYLEENGYQPSCPVRVLDMACGSGSFLIEAFDMLDHYVARGRNQPLGECDDIVDCARPVEILSQNIYGVDKDEQAVAVAKLNLSLKALHMREKLPMLENIRVGDSLIYGSREELKEEFGEQWKDRRPFNWDIEFPDLMSSGGFDVIVGNPPYVSFGLRGTEKKDKQFDTFVRAHYPGSAEYKISTYALFMNRAIDLLRDGGILGFIVPDSFLLGRYFSKLRRYILDKCRIDEIILFSEDFWQGGIVGFPVVIILKKEQTQRFRRSNLTTVRLCESPEQLVLGMFAAENAYKQSYFETIPFNRFRLFFDPMSKQIVERMEARGVELVGLANVASGLIGKKGKDTIVSGTRRDDNWLPGITSGAEISKYVITPEGDFICFDKDELKSGFRDAQYFQPKLLMRQTGDSLIAAYDEDHLLCLNNIHVVNVSDSGVQIKYLLGLLNSRLMGYYYHTISLELGRVMAQTDIETVERLPIRPINSDDPVDVRQHDKIVELVDEMLTLQKDYTEAESQKEERRHNLKRRIDQLDEAIDQLVYEMYGLKEEEIKIVEGK